LSKEKGQRYKQSSTKHYTETLDRATRNAPRMLQRCKQFLF